MSVTIPRTCTEIDTDDFPAGRGCPSRPLDGYRDTDAYVLLGAPGAGKSTAFKHEAGEIPNGYLFTARDFITFDGRPQWHDKTLFIDGLDEVRAGTADGRSQLDAIRTKLDALGRPRFRLSCREAHWFGANDSSHLAAVSPNGTVAVLRLDPLTESDVREMLDRSQEIDDADAFLAAVGEKGIDGLLTNPMTLTLLTKVVAGGAWPDSRARTFELACEKLVREHNREHGIAQLNGHDVTRLMQAAGRLCAIQLLTGAAGFALLPGVEDTQHFPSLERMPGDDRNLLRQVLDTRLFAAPPGDCGQGHAAPVHRQIAEFMAARYLATLIGDGLPADRILALITGHDGGIVSEMRGLSAWLAVHSMGARAQLIVRDPLGAVLYGDTREFSKAEKCRLLDAVATQAANDPWTAGEIPPDARLGDIVTPDMAGTFGQLLSASVRNHPRQSFAFILLAILHHTPAIPELAELLLATVRDAKCQPGLRREALEVCIGWTRHEEPSRSALGALLSDISSGSVSDPDGDLLGTLLNALYPAVLSVPEILPHLRTPRQVSRIGPFSTFWRRTVPRESSPSQLAEILDAITNDFDHLRPAFLDAPGAVSPMRGVPALLLGRLLDQPGAELTAHRLFGWLGVVCHRDLRNTRLDTDGIRSRLRSDGPLLEELIREAVAQCSDSSDFSRCMNELERRFLQVPWPPNWCLQQAVTATDCDVAAYFVRRVASFVHSNPDSAELSRHCVETRLQADTQLLDTFHQTLAILVERQTRSDDPLSQEDSDRAVHRREWRESLLPHMPALRENRGQPRLLHHLAQVYFGDFVDIEGATSGDRLRDLLGDDGTLTGRFSTHSANRSTGTICPMKPKSCDLPRKTGFITSPCRS